MKFFTIMPVFLAGLLIFTAPAVAQQEDQAEKTADKVVAPQPLPPSQNPYMDKIRLQALKLSKSLEPAQTLVLQNVRNGFGMIRSVKMVMGDISDAVNLCKDNVPEIAEDISSRHQTWAAAVNGALQGGEDMVEALVSRDIFAENTEEVEVYLDLTDKAAVYADQHLEKSIVTTPETCEILLDSMDNTQEDLVALINDIDWPDPETAVEDAKKELQKRAKNNSKKRQATDTQDKDIQDKQLETANDTKAGSDE